MIVKKNLNQIYNMKVMVREHPVFDCPEIIPIWVLSTAAAEHPLRIHVICGGGSAGVLNQGCDDWTICKALEDLGIPVVFHNHCEDFTGGRLAERLETIRSRSRLLTIGDHDEFLDLVRGSASKDEKRKDFTK